MTSNNYEYFLTIVECGSITKAAEKLFVSQPSLSQYLKRLEKNLGAELFDRNTSPLKLTFPGERYYEYALQQKKLDEAMIKEFQDIKSQDAGVLSIGVALWRGASLLPAIFPRFHEMYPKISLELVEGPFDMVLNSLLKDKIDIAVFNTVQFNEGIVCETILEEPLLLAMPTGHPVTQKYLANQPPNAGAYPIAPIDIITELPLVMGRPEQNNYKAITNMLHVYNLEPEILLTTANTTTAINLVKTGICGTFVPGEGAKVCQHPGQVTYFMIDVPELWWPLVVAHKKGSYLTRISRLFIEELKNNMEKY